MNSVWSIRMAESTCWVTPAREQLAPLRDTRVYFRTSITETVNCPSICPVDYRNTNAKKVIVALIAAKRMSGRVRVCFLKNTPYLDYILFLLQR